MEPFVGRHGELSTLATLWQLVVNWRGSILFVVDGLGVGKTALAKRFAAQVQESTPTALVGYGKCEEQGGSEAYHVAVEALKNLIAQQTDTAILQSLAEVMADTAPAWLNLIPLVGVPLAAAVAIFQKARQKVGSASPRELPPDTMLQQLAALVRQLNKRGPLLLIFDDMQWADPSSVALITYLSSHCRGVAMFLIVIYRSSDYITLGQPIYGAALELEKRDECERLELLPLPEDEFSQLLSQLVPHHTLPKELLDKLFKYTAGNPLFLKRIIEQWKLEQKLVQQEGMWKLSQPVETIEIPNSLRGLLERGFQLLPEQVRQTLLYASLEGEQFTSRITAELLDQPELRVVQILRNAEMQYRLIVQMGSLELPDDQVTNQYRFAHPFYYRVVNDQLTPVERVQLNRKAADAIEKLNLRQPDSLESLAFHFREGRSWKKAAEYLVLVADQYHTSYPHRALEGYSSALDLLDQKFPADEQPWLLNLRGRIHSGRGEVFTLQGKVAEAIAEQRLALDYFTSAGDEIAQARQLNRLVRTTCILHGYGEAMQHLERALTSYGQLSIRGVEKLDLLAFAGWVYVDQGNPQSRIREYFLEAEKLMLEISSVESLDYADEVGFYYRRFGLYEKSEEVARWAFKLSLEHKTRRAEAFSLRDLGFASFVKGKFVTALKQLTTARAVAREIGAIHDECLILEDLSLLRSASNQFDEALRIRQEAFDLSHLREDLWHMAFDKTYLGLLHHKLGDSIQARALCQEAVDTFSKIQSKHRLAWASSCLGFVEKNVERLGAAIDQLRGMEDNVRLARAHRYLGIIQRDASQFELAIKALCEALTIHEGLNVVTEIIEDLRELSAAYAQSDESALRFDCLSRLRNLYDSLEVSGDPGFEAFQRRMLQEVDSALAQ